jgi:hypothetical protein
MLSSLPYPLLQKLKNLKEIQLNAYTSEVQNPNHAHADTDAVAVNNFLSALTRATGALRGIERIRVTSAFVPGVEIPNVGSYVSYSIDNGKNNSHDKKSVSVHANPYDGHSSRLISCLVDKWLLAKSDSDSDRTSGSDGTTKTSTTTVGMEISLPTIVYNWQSVSRHMSGFQHMIRKLTVTDAKDRRYLTDGAISTSLSHFVQCFSQLNEIYVQHYQQDQWTRGYGFPLSKLKGFRVISEALSFIIDPTCTLPSFQFSNDTDALGIDHVRQEIVNAVLKNNSLLSIQLDIRHNDTNILTAEDEATIQQHIENHRKTIRNEIESIGWHSNMEEDKMEYMPSGVSDLIYQYIIPQ